MSKLKKEAHNDWVANIKNQFIIYMQNKAEKVLNPLHYHISSEARKRLRWMYILYYEQSGNVTVTARKIGVSRQWLSIMKTVFENKDKDPRSLEPKSKSPHSTKHRNRISEDVEMIILEVRNISKNVWGKEKITRVIKRDYNIKINPNTVNKYLHKHHKIGSNTNK